MLFRPLSVLALAGAAFIAAPASWAQASADGSQAQAREVRAWLLRIHEAASHRNFQGTFVVSGGGAVSSARISHYCQGPNQFERSEALDGQARQVYRHNDEVTTLWPGTKVAMVERRRETRYPFPFLVNLAPVGEDGITPSGESVVVVGKHVSEQGLGFYHPQPLPHRRAIASLEGSRGDWFGFLIDLRWCRFTRHGWYESGGRFLQAVASPME